MNRPSLVSRSKFSVSDSDRHAAAAQLADSGQDVRSGAAPPVGLPEHQGVASLQGGQGPGEFWPRRAAPAGLLLGEQLVIAVRAQGIELQLGVLVSGGDPAVGDGMAHQGLRPSGNVYLPRTP